MEFDLSLIVDTAVRVIRKAQIEIHKDILADPSRAFEPVSIGRRQKPLLAVDLVAENNAARRLRDGLYPLQIVTIGEESLRDESIDFSGEKKLVVLMDMVDGTDLLERNLSNWCSAMVFYYPPDRRIVAAFVGLPGDGVYFATEVPNQPVKKLCFHGDPKLIGISGPSGVRNVSSASLAFYGQKIKNLLSVADHEGFLDSLKRLQRPPLGDKLEVKTRIYNLAGNPMMMRLVDGHTRIDAVFDIEGQAPHDVVPGAYIAQRAGAILSDPDGRGIDLAQILLRPADPNSHIRYILTSTQELSQEMQHCLRPLSGLAAGDPPKM